MVKVNKKNAEVTEAVLDAERKLDACTQAYARLLRAEMAIEQDEALPELERDIARVGTATARMTLDVLRALGGPPPT